MGNRMNIIILTEGWYKKICVLAIGFIFIPDRWFICFKMSYCLLSTNLRINLCIDASFWRNSFHLSFNWTNKTRWVNDHLTLSGGRCYVLKFKKIYNVTPFFRVKILVKFEEFFHVKKILYLFDVTKLAQKENTGYSKTINGLPKTIIFLLKVQLF